MYVLALAFVCQWLEPIPAPGEVGADVRVIVRTIDGGTLAGVDVGVRRPDGALQPIGTTDGEGAVLFRPEVAGDHELRAVLPARELALITPYRVLAPRRRWLYAMVCLPLGAFLLWWNLRNWKRAGAVPRSD